MDERMEAIMRKLTAMALSMMFILGSIIPVGAEETQTRQTTISVSIDPVYTVQVENLRTVKMRVRQLHIRLWMVTKNSVQLHMQRVETVLI